MAGFSSTPINQDLRLNNSNPNPNKYSQFILPPPDEPDLGGSPEDAGEETAAAELAGVELELAATEVDATLALEEAGADEAALDDEAATMAIE